MLDKLFLQDYIKKNNIPNNPRRYLVEYLQSEILEAVYNSKFGRHLSLLGGTCLRFAYKIDRFSEDLDFDLIKKKLDYQELAKFIEKKLSQLGFSVDTRVKRTENIVIIFIKFAEVMNQMGISDQIGQKLKIKFEIDPNPQKNISYQAKQIFTYGKNFNLIANTESTIFAQKIVALKFRPYQKGRDFYDLIWFLNQKNIEPDYKILKEKKINIANRQEVIIELKKIIAKLDLKQAAKDVERFLFYPEKAKWILIFEKYLDEYAPEPRT